MTELCLALDSGAHSIYNKHAAGGKSKGGLAREKSTWEFYDSQEFADYLDGYIRHCRIKGSRYAFYVTLDAIFNPELSWTLYQQLLSAGINPMPVFHFGEPLEYLKKMCEETDYVGIGGLGQDITTSKFITFGDEVFKYLKGSGIRTHGFAMSSPGLLKRYPWTSVDSTTANFHARTGVILVPVKRGTKFMYSKWYSFDVSERTRERKGGKHYVYMSPLYRKTVDEYLDTIGLTFDDVCDDYHYRDIANSSFMMRMADEICKGKITYYISGRTSARLEHLPAFAQALHRLRVPRYNYLGTHFDPQPTKLMLRAFNTEKESSDGKYEKPTKGAETQRASLVD